MKSAVEWPVSSDADAGRSAITLALLQAREYKSAVVARHLVLGRESETVHPERDTGLHLIDDEHGSERPEHWLRG
jgi:hypothetical protein